MKIQCQGHVCNLWSLLILLVPALILSAQATPLSLRDRHYLEHAIFRRLFPSDSSSHLPTPGRGKMPLGAVLDPDTPILDYDDFPEMPPFLSQFGDASLMQPKGKRYLGIDIPDYIANGGKGDALKHMSDKMKAMGKRRRK